MTSHDKPKYNEPYSNPLMNEDEAYTENDLAHIFRQGDFKSWDDTVDWLHNSGGEDNYLHPGKVKNIHDDLVALKNADQEFSTDPNELYQKITNYKHV